MNKEPSLDYIIEDLVKSLRGTEEDWQIKSIKAFILKALKSQREEGESYIEHNDRTENFCITIVQSPQWIAWDKISHLRGWDSSESSETGWLSKEHLQAFLKFVKNEYNE